MSSTDTDKTSAVDQPQETGPWDEALDKLREWDPAWAETCKKMSTNPWTNGIISLKTIELICVALNGACTNLQTGWHGPSHPRRPRCVRDEIRTEDDLQGIEETRITSCRLFLPPSKPSIWPTTSLWLPDSSSSS